MNEEDRQALLDQLHDVQLPELSAWPAAGWWLLLLSLILLVIVAMLSWRRYQARSWQREAFTELQRLRDQVVSQPTNSTLADCSRLARRVLLAVRSRSDVANLQGKAWLEELDSVCQQPLFAQGFGRLLEAGPYQRDPQISQNDLESLFDALEELVRSAARRQPTTTR
ncbi:DUF4381 domain-containing protein [Granulosicoccus antarcticus]|uniref:DUF4381 domain-containing protein n=1 Tax=Granulosicoccus antarcticus IMCC3135 TaxID=1192854 RepID=A0A2Z2P6M9_9GAMM|nr:DUF4381 domain-containing protein [Granulosicoccus antarcticus]ASJ75514.1 hypothetical protein IMCC3135_27295 [Granulosicoccus antarcticus IMCC3135]